MQRIDDELSLFRVALENQKQRVDILCEREFKLTEQTDSLFQETQSFHAALTGLKEEMVCKICQEKEAMDRSMHETNLKLSELLLLFSQIQPAVERNASQMEDLSALVENTMSIHLVKLQETCETLL